MKRKVKSVIRTFHIAGYRRGRADGFQRGYHEGFDLGQKQVRHPGNVEGDASTNSDTGTNTIALETLEKLDVLIIAPAVIASLEIGILQPFEEIKRQTTLHYKVKTEGEVTKEFIDSANTIVFLRNVEPAAYQYLEWAHEMGKKTIYVIDDNFTDIPPTTRVGLYYQDPVRQETFIKFLRNAQTIKVDAPFFGDYIRMHYNSNVAYFPASVDFSWIEQVEKPPRHNGQIVIGYAGGAKEDAFAAVSPAILKIIDYYGGFVRFEFFGFIPSGLIGHPSVHYIEGVADYRTYLQRLQQCTWDIGLAPLEPVPFNHYKSNNKFRDYSACLIPGMYSALPAYKDWVTHGETGYLMASHTKDSWYAGIKQMVEDPAMRQRIKENAMRLAKEHFTVGACADKWKNLIAIS